MVYIPIVPVTPAAPPSPEAQDLGLKIAELVRLMRQENPEIGPADIRQGLQLAAQNLRPEIGGSGGAIVALSVAVVVGLAILGVFIAKSDGQVLGRSTMLSIVVMVGILLVIIALRLAFYFKNQSRSG